MKSAAFITIALACQGAWASPPVGSSKSIYSDPELEFELVSKFLVQFFGTALYSYPEDPLEYEDFTYGLLGPISVGESNITNAKVQGLSNFERNITIQKELEEISFSLRFPQIVFAGNYSLDCDVGLCFPGTCDTAIDHYTGVGEYNHIFRNVTLNATFTLDHSTDTFVDPSIRFTPQRARIEFENCSLHADDFRMNGLLQTNWEERSASFKRNYVENETRQFFNNIIFGEISAGMLNLVSRMQLKRVEQIYDDLVEIGAEILP